MPSEDSATAELWGTSGGDQKHMCAGTHVCKDMHAQGYEYKNTDPGM